MTLLSIFCPRFREAGGHPSKGDDNTDGGFVVNYWFKNASNRIGKAIGKKQECSNPSPIKQASNRLLGQKQTQCECGKCKEKGNGLTLTSAKPKKIRPPRKEPKPKHTKISAIKAADSSSAFAAHLKQSKLLFTSNNIRESSKMVDGLPNKFRVVIIREGLGNMGDCYYYTKQALESAVPIFEGTKIYADHPTSEDEQIRPERSTKDILGHFENVELETDDQGCAILCADLDIVPTTNTEWARGLLSRAIENSKKFPDKDFVGLSINANGDSESADIRQILDEAPAGAKPKLEEAQANGIDLVKVVRSIKSAVSCDLVTEAGAGGKIQDFIEGDKTDGKKSENKSRKRR